jgi:hypothetical protein
LPQVVVVASLASVAVPPGQCQAEMSVGERLLGVGAVQVDFLPAAGAGQPRRRCGGRNVTRHLEYLRASICMLQGCNVTRPAMPGEAVLLPADTPAARAWERFPPPGWVCQCGELALKGGYMLWVGIALAVSGSAANCTGLNLVKLAHAQVTIAHPCAQRCGAEVGCVCARTRAVKLADTFSLVCAARRKHRRC